MFRSRSLWWLAVSTVALTMVGFTALAVRFYYTAPALRYSRPWSEGISIGSQDVRSIVDAKSWETIDSFVRTLADRTVPDDGCEALWIKVIDQWKEVQESHIDHLADTEGVPVAIAFWGLRAQRRADRTGSQAAGTAAQPTSPTERGDVIEMLGQLMEMGGFRRAYAAMAVAGAGSVAGTERWVRVFLDEGVALDSRPWGMQFDLLNSSTLAEAVARLYGDVGDEGQRVVVQDLLVRRPASSTGGGLIGISRIERNSALKARALACAAQCVNLSSDGQEQRAIFQQIEKEVRGTYLTPTSSSEDRLIGVGALTRFHAKWARKLLIDRVVDLGDVSVARVVSAALMENPAQADIELIRAAYPTCVLGVRAFLLLAVARNSMAWGDATYAAQWCHAIRETTEMVLASPGQPEEVLRAAVEATTVLDEGDRARILLGSVGRIVVDSRTTEAALRVLSVSGGSETLEIARRALPVTLASEQRDFLGRLVTRLEAGPR